MKHLILILSILTISLFVPLSTSATDKIASENYNSSFGYAMVCPSCGYENFFVTIDEEKAKIYYTCKRCQWVGEDDLPTN